MRSIHKPRTRRDRRYRRHLRVRCKVRGVPERPRLVVFRSLKHIYAQLVDDTTGTTLLAVSDLSRGLTVDGAGKVGKGEAVGKLLAQRAKERQIERVVFDRGGYRYKGRVRAVADGARAGGLEF